MLPVNSHNEWDTLKEVIVGNGFPIDLPHQDIGFRLFYHDNIYDEKKSYHAEQWKIDADKKIQHEEDLNTFCDLLRSNNITVKRPKAPSTVKTTKTLCWSSNNFPALNVRDLTMIVGNEIIETPVSARWRQFENDYMKHIFIEYFRAGAKWTSAPRPLVTDNSYDFSRVFKDKDAQDYYESLKSKYSNPLDCGVEPMFDAANCMRLGDVILFNAPTEHERLGAEWLQRHLGSQYKVWVINIADHHIDSIFLPLRPGLALITLDIKDKLPPPLQKWEFIEVPAELDPVPTKDYIPLASEKIYCNVLSISPEKIICMPEYYEILKDKLSKYNIECIPNRLRFSRLFGGGHHCLTLDIKRESKIESYFNL
jgi:glycine amidinotransferase